MNGPRGAQGGVVLPGIEGKVALVTGGSRGIGRAVAVLLSSLGARVGIGYRSDRDAARDALRAIEEVARGTGPGSTPWAEAADLSTEAGVSGLFARLDDESGGALDVFVANAGTWNESPRPAVELGAREWKSMLETNLTSAFLTTREAARRMKAGGRIVLISSTAAQRGEAGHAHYAASKGAMQSFVKSLAVELGPAGINVNAVAPGWVDTDMTAGVLVGAARERIIEGIPLRRIASPADIAGPVAFLASDLARHVTGEIVNVNGGSVLCG